MNKNNDNSAFILFLTFFILSWIVYLFPEVIEGFYKDIVARLLLIFGILFVSVMGDEHNKQLYGDFGVGLGFMIICIAFMEYIPYKPSVRLPFFLFFGIFGIYGVLRAVTEKILDIYNLKNVSETTINKKKSTIKLVAIQQALIYLIEFLAALVTVLQYIGIKFP